MYGQEYKRERRKGIDLGRDAAHSTDPTPSPNEEAGQGWGGGPGNRGDKPHEQHRNEDSSPPGNDHQGAASAGAGWESTSPPPLPGPAVTTKQDQAPGLAPVAQDAAVKPFPKRKILPAKGVTDKKGRRQALDFGRPPEHEHDEPSRLEVLYPRLNPKQQQQQQQQQEQQPTDARNSSTPEVEQQQQQQQQQPPMKKGDGVEEASQGSQDRRGPRSEEALQGSQDGAVEAELLATISMLTKQLAFVKAHMQSMGFDLIDAETSVKQGEEEAAKAAEEEVMERQEEAGAGDEHREPEDGQQWEADNEDPAQQRWEEAPESADVKPFPQALEHKLSYSQPEYKGPPRPRSTLQNAVGWFVRRRNGYYIPQDDGDDAGGQLAAGSGVSAAMALKKPSAAAVKAKMYGEMTRTQREQSAAISIQKAFRLYQMHKKFFILTDKKKRERIAAAGGDPFNADKFGPDSLAKRKPIEVAKYLKDNKIENFIVEQVKGFLQQKFLSTNPYPELLIRMRMRQILDTEFLREGYRDEDFHAKFMANAANVEDRARDGRLLAAAYFTNLEPTRTMWGEKHIMAFVDAAALDQLRTSLGKLVEGSVITLDDAHKIVIGRALTGRCIYHVSSSPFPAALELQDECVGIGKDFERIVDAYAAHIIQDMEKMEETCVHVIISSFFVGIATAGGEFQKFNKWSLREIRAKRKAFMSEINNSTVNSRVNYVDFLLRVKMREIPGAQSLEIEQAGGGWGFITCRKRYSFHYHMEENSVCRSYAEHPFSSLYNGLFFDKDFAQLYALKRVAGPTKGSVLGGLGKVIAPELVEDYLENLDNMTMAADREGDIMLVAECSLAPAMIREALGTQADDAQLVRCQRLRMSGAAKVRAMCDHMYAIEVALDTIAAAEERVVADKASEGLIRDTEASPRAKAGGFEIEASMRVVMGQLTWLTRDLGDLVGLCIGGIDLDALSTLILQRFDSLISEWTVERKMDAAYFSRTLRWARNVGRSCYLSHAHSIFSVDPITVRHNVSVDAIQKFEKLIVKDVVAVDEEVENEIKGLRVPKGKAKETVLLRYVTDTGIDTFVEGLLRALTDGSLFPNPRMRAMRHMRAYSQYFLLWKSFNLDILNTFARLSSEVSIAEGSRAMMLHVHQSHGLPPLIPAPGQPHSRMPQPGLWTPPDTKPAVAAYGTKVALQAWFATMAAVGAGAEPRKKKNGSYEVSSGAAARGGAHFNTGYSSKLWWLAHLDAKAMVDSLKNLKPFPKTAYTLRIATAIRKLCVHPAPYMPILHLRFARASMYEYYDIEGPKKVMAIQLACSHFVDHMSKLHDASPHVPFGIYVAQAKSPDSALPAGLSGPLGEVELPGAGHMIWSPSQCKQLPETVLTSMREAVLEGRSVFSVGLYHQEPRWPPGEAAKEAANYKGLDDKKAEEKRLEAERREQEEKASPGYIMYLVHLLISFSPSAGLVENSVMPGDRELFWPRDDHAMNNVVFFTKKEAMEAMSLFPLNDYEEEPCSETNSRQHYEGLKRSMGVFAHEGNYVDLMHAVWQRGHLVSHVQDLGRIMEEQNLYEQKSKAAFSSGRHYIDTLFARKQKELSALSDAFRVMHSTTENLNTLQWCIITIGAVLALQAPEVRMKVNLKALLMQSIQLKRRLTNLLLEEPNKIYMTGLYRSMYLRIDEILDNITAIVDKPQLFADTVAASQPTRDEHFTGPDMHQASDVVSGRASAALAAMSQLHSKLSALSLAVSRTSYESCEVVKAVLESDEKKRVEENTTQRKTERQREEEVKAERERRFRESELARLQAEEESDATLLLTGAAQVTNRIMHNKILNRFHQPSQESIPASMTSLLGSIKK